ncbi:MAG: hypothetical protein K0S11_976 [Gammaproteobacteria bacterium]|jgi:hypothetical protein|nr:hypothetical protein [Gammaproteobacteria bacterium]
MLRTLQQKLQTSLRSSLEEEISASYLFPSETLSVKQRLAIYRHNILASLLRALTEHYPVCKKLIGDTAFTGIAKQYMALYPSQCADLNSYGASLADFMETLPYIEQVAYLPDVARLEWSCHRVLQAPDTLGLDWYKLAELPSENHEQLIFELAPSVNLLSSSYPIHRIWSVNQTDYNGPEPINLDEGGVKLIVWRYRNELCLKPLDELSWQVLVAFSQQTSLGEIFTRLKMQEALLVLLPEFINQGWLANFSVATVECLRNA